MGKEEIKLSLLIDNIIQCVENPKESIKKLELINEFNKDAGYEINIQKSIVCLCTFNDQSENGIQETISFTMHQKLYKVLRNEFFKGSKNLCSENDKMLLKETKEDLNKWEKSRMFIDQKTQHC